MLLNDVADTAENMRCQSINPLWQDKLGNISSSNPIFLEIISNIGTYRCVIFSFSVRMIILEHNNNVCIYLCIFSVYNF